MLQIVAVPNIPLLETELQFWDCLFNGLSAISIQDHDIIILAHTPLSRIFGYRYNLEEINPSPQALELAESLEKDARVVEVILQNSKKVIKAQNRILITENLAGVVCANAGIDLSNAGQGFVVAIPPNPNDMAARIQQRIQEEFAIRVAIIISDTVGRALRNGAVNIAIGVAGIDPIRSEIGKQDLFGYTLRVSETAHVDELASAAELVQGQTDQGNPFVVIRGYSFQSSTNLGADVLNRSEDRRLFK